MSVAPRETRDAAELELQSIMGRGGGQAPLSSGGGGGDSDVGGGGARRPLRAADDDDPEPGGWWPAPSRPPTPTAEDARRQKRTAVAFATVGAVLVALAVVTSSGGGQGQEGAAVPGTTADPAAAAAVHSPPAVAEPSSSSSLSFWSEDSVAILGGDGSIPDAAASAAGGGGGADEDAAAADERDAADLARAVAALGDGYVPCVGPPLRCGMAHPRPLPGVDFRGVPRHAVSRLAAAPAGGERRRRRRQRRRAHEAEAGGGGGGGGEGQSGGGPKRRRGHLRRRLAQEEGEEEGAAAAAAAAAGAKAGGAGGMVAADSSRCSEVGRDVLREGGNAADAAVAVGLCQGVVSPMSCGLGGGAFILVRMSAEGAAAAAAGRAAARAAGAWTDAAARSGGGGGPDDPGGAPAAEFIDARETAPAAAAEAMYAGMPPSASAEGGLAVAVPTELLGYAALFDRHGSGRVPWARLVAPAAELAREGFGAHPYLVHTLLGNRTLARVRRSRLLREAFLIRRGGGPAAGRGRRGSPAAADGVAAAADAADDDDDDGASWRVPLPGELCCRRPALARTLDAVAARGARHLYEGRAAEALAAAVRAAGGVLTARDLADARADVGIAPFEVDVPLPPGAPGVAAADGAAAGAAPAAPPAPPPPSLRLVLPPPPSSAAVVAFGLRFLAGYLANDTADSGADEAASLAAFAALGGQEAGTSGLGNSGGSGSSIGGGGERASDAGGLWAHRLAEALKHGFAARTALGDGAFAGLARADAEDIAAAASDLASNASYCSELRAETRDGGVLAATRYGGRWNPLLRAQVDPPEDHGTSHYSVVDGALSAVSVTTTVNMVFGSGVVDAASGVLLNDEMDDFSQPGRASFVTPHPSRANFIAPRKRPLSAMSPIFAADARTGRLRAAVGASGGPLIVSAALQVLARALLLPPPLPPSLPSPPSSPSSSSPLSFVAAPRLHAQLLPSASVYVEDFSWGRTSYRWPGAALAGMEGRGQELRAIAGGLGVVQLVLVEEEEGEGGRGEDARGAAAAVSFVLHGVSDPRKDGAPMAA